MPLPPGGKTPWPPPDQHEVYRRYTEHAAWYSGDPNKLVDYYAYGAYRGQGWTGDLSVGQHIHSIWRTNFDRFWARATTAPWRRQMLHVPLAADIATTSADLLFGEPVDFTIEEAEEKTAQPGAIAVQDRLNELIEAENINATLNEAAETAAALGGVYLRIVWDEALEPDHPLLCRVDADGAVPEFWYGRLTAVTFWRVLPMPDDKQHVWRLLERHEPGYILQGLYRGTGDELGDPQALTIPQEQLVVGQSFEPVVNTEIQQLTACYIPNMRPNRLMRDEAYGRSDYDGVEAMLDSLDETYTSWMRDLRLARARLLIASEYLDAQGPGKGAVMDLDQEVFEKIEMGRNDVPITPSQFAIRSADHLATSMALIERIVSAAGYAMATFGLQEQQRGVTATEIISRERRSFVTRGKKVSYWQRPLADIMEAYLAIDNEHFQSHEVFKPRVTFKDAVQEDPAQTAATIVTLMQAKAASIETLVRMAHDDWSDEEVAAEVLLIKEENPVPQIQTQQQQPAPGTSAGGKEAVAAGIGGPHEPMARGATSGSDTGNGQAPPGGY